MGFLNNTEIVVGIGFLIFVGVLVLPSRTWGRCPWSVPWVCCSSM
jgi:hypothetical protein